MVFGVQMVWEHGCTVIVMLSPLAEDSVKQCDRYWPDEGSSLYHIYEASAGWQQGAPRSPCAGGTASIAPLQRAERSRSGSAARC